MKNKKDEWRFPTYLKDSWYYVNRNGSIDIYTEKIITSLTGRQVKALVNKYLRITKR